MRYGVLYARLFPLGRRGVVTALPAIVKRATARGSGRDWRLVENAARFLETQAVAEAARLDPGVRGALRRAEALSRLRRSVAARCIQRAAVRFLWQPGRAIPGRLVDALLDGHLLALPT